MSNYERNKKQRPFYPKDGSEDPHPLLIPLQNYSPNHHTYRDKDTKDSFVGRKKLVKELCKLLQNTKNERGSYLIAGYRGSGKTSLINRVINLYKGLDEGKEHTDKQKNLIVAHINLGHDTVLDTRNVLFNIISVLLNETKKRIKKEKCNWCFVVVLSLIYGVLVYSGVELNSFSQKTPLNNQKLCQALDSKLSIDIEKKPIGDDFDQQYKLYGDHCIGMQFHNVLGENLNPISNKKEYKVTFGFILYLSILSVLFYSSRFRTLVVNVLDFNDFGYKKNRKKRSLQKIQKLYDRVAYSFEKDVGLLGIRKTGFGFKQKTNIPEMKEPQIELELVQALDYFKEAGYEVILLFDELDKISLTVTESEQNIESIEQIPDGFENETLETSSYRRKKKVDSLLAGLKTLITVGHAKFFFIAGRDMLDSYQSEKGSTSSLYESLFNQVFEVPSFLTDDSDKNETRLHSIIESFVCKQLMDADIAVRYWYINKITGELLDKLDRDLELLGNKLTEKDINKIAKFILSFFVKNMGIKEILKFKIYKFHLIPLQRYRFSRILINETDKKNQKKIIARCVTSILVQGVDVYTLKRVLANVDSKNGRNFYQKRIDQNYISNPLNIFYLYLLDENLSENDTKIVIYTLNQFIHYLTVHSWGNCKRLISLFESFTLPIELMKPGKIHNSMNWLPTSNDTKYMLHFGVTERQRISMGSNLYVMFNHHLSRQFTGADKLVVSTMAALHYCLKFHRNSFSRHHLFRMTEMMSIYSSPELNSIFETTLSLVLWPYIRVVRNGMPQYRFFTWIEQEIRYIARVNDLESASYTFSLDAINNIKKHYQRILDEVMSTYKKIEKISSERGPGLVAEINIVLGDIYLLERAYDQSVVYYQTAVNAHHQIKKKEKYHLECLLRYVEALLKLGNVQEHRQRYDRAAMNYYQAKELVVDYLKQEDKLNEQSKVEIIKSNFSLNKPIAEKGIRCFITDCDPKWVLLKQPYWALLNLDIKKSHADRINVPKELKDLYKPQDPYYEYRKGQLYFFMGKFSEARQSLCDSILNVLYKQSDQHENRIDQYYGFYLLPTACVHFAENAICFSLNKCFKEKKVNSLTKEKLSTHCFDLISSLSTVKHFEDLKIVKLKDIVDKGQIPFIDMLKLLFFAADEFESNKLYDHAAMAYLKAFSLWIVVTEMIQLDKFDSKKKELKEKINSQDKWLDEAIKKAMHVIRNSNGQAQQQANEKWQYRHAADYPSRGDSFCIEDTKKKLLKLKSHEGRKQLTDDVIFWQGSYLGQQLIAMVNWIFTAKRALLDEEPSPIKGYRLPLYSTRSMVLSSWTNGRELLAQAKLIQFILGVNPEHYLSEEEKKAKKGQAQTIYDELNENYKKSLSSSRKIDNLTSEQAYYTLSAKAIHSFYSALHYTRILTDNNQAIIMPPTAFVMLHLWRTLYGLVEYEKKKNQSYEQCRSIVRQKLMNYVSKDVPSSHLDLNYVSDAAIRQLRILINMGNPSSSSRLNILQNKYYLDDDFEDPGFHLDWTIVQMLIPSASTSTTWIENSMSEIKK